MMIDLSSFFDLNTFLLIFFLIGLLFISGFFSASETALFSLPYTRVKAYQVSKNPRKHLIAQLILEPKDLLVTIFMLNTLANILLQNLASGLFGNLASFWLKVGIPFVLTLLFGEIIPKYIGLQNHTKLASAVAPTIYFIQTKLTPLRKLIIKITEPVSRFLFFFLKKEENISKEELSHILKTSKEHGVIQEEEAELLFGYLNLQDKIVKELMQPRSSILFYNIKDPLSKLTYLFVEQKCTRIPVCHLDLQNLMGIITAQEFFIHKQEIKYPEEIEKHLFKPLYIPETALARSLLRRFNETKEEMAIVVDEYGSISGLITYEDLVELVVGEITDLRDDKTIFSRNKKSEIVCSGRLELKEFNHLFDANLFSQNNLVTIGGWLIENLGDIPSSGTKFETAQFLFQVLASDQSKIDRLYIRRLKK